ncbi:MAG: CDP-glucose 4,6-dehydratase [Rariglobus sp.]
MAFTDIYRGKSVLLTGHTGFKGAWLAEWLLALGAEVHGLALPPPEGPALFNALGLESRLHHHIADVRDLAAIERVITEARPDFVFHLAAQPLVRASYAQPVETYATNVMGTVHVLEALRRAARPCTVIAVTTDKCYENREWLHAYREEDPLGGHDPYSSSKGAAEIAIASYRRSFFSSAGTPVRLASARAGNVIGGGDWAADRIVPDCIRALQLGQPVRLRNPRATRPWQHVLEPLSGYLWLAARLAGTTAEPATLASAFNFGPALTSNRPVGDLVNELLRHLPGRREDQPDPGAPHEAGLLNLATDKAHHLLGWRSAWNFERTVAETAVWYRDYAATPTAAAEITRRQITTYTADAVSSGLAWAHA